MNITEIRQKYPQYSDISDTELVTALHGKYYSDIPFSEFSQRIGLQPTNPQAVQAGSGMPEGTDIRDFDIASLDQSLTTQPAPQPSGVLPLSEVPGKFANQVKTLPGFLFNKVNSLTPEEMGAVGATAASALAPQAGIPAQLTTKFGPEIAAFLTRMIGAGAGGFVGRAGGEINQGTDIGPALLKGAESGAENAAWEFAGPLIDKIPFQKMLAPVARSMSPEMGALQDAAKAWGVPMSPSAFRPSWAASAAEGVTDMFLPSRVVKDEFYRKKALVRFNQLASQEIPEMVSAVKPAAEVNKSAVEEFRRLYDELEMGSKGLRNEFLDDIGRTTEIPVAKTKAAYEKIIRSSTDDSLIRHAQMKLDQIKDGAFVAEDIDRAFTQVGKLKPKVDADLITEVKNAIKSDLEAAKAPMEKFTEANETFRAKFGLFAGKAKQIEAALRKGSDEIPSLTRDTFRSNNPALVKYMQENMNPEVFKDLMTENLSLMLRDSAIVGGAGAKTLRKSTKLPDQMIFDGAKLDHIIEQNIKTLKAVYPKSVIDALKNFAALNKMAAKDIAKMEKGMDPFFQMAQTGGLGAGGYHDLGTAIFGSAGTAALAKSLMNEKGILHNWLTSGMSESKKKVAAEGLKIGGRMVFSDGDD